MDWLVAWFRAHNVSTHGIAAAIGSLAIIVETDTRIRDLLLKDFNIHPKLIPTLTCLGAIILAYKKSTKT